MCDDYPDSTSRLFPLVYEQLRRVAARQMARERRGHTLQTTALVHEAYLRLLANESVSAKDRASVFRAAAEAMRRILVERARGRRRLKRGGNCKRVPLDEADAVTLPPPVDILALDEALKRLAAHDRRKSEVVTLRYFGGMTVEQTARTLGVSPATVKNDWSYAKAWLHREFCGTSRAPDGPAHAD